MKKNFDRFKPPSERDGYEITGDYDHALDGDKKVLQQLIDAGCDLSQPRHVLHYLYFATTANAEGAASELRDCEYKTELHASIEASSEVSYLVVAERNGIVSEEIVESERLLMAGIAGRFEGDHDGWEAQMD